MLHVFSNVDETMRNMRIVELEPDIGVRIPCSCRLAHSVKKAITYFGTALGELTRLIFCYI